MSTVGNDTVRNELVKAFEEGLKATDSYDRTEIGETVTEVYPTKDWGSLPVSFFSDGKWSIPDLYEDVAELIELDMRSVLIEIEDQD